MTGDAAILRRAELDRLHGAARVRRYRSLVLHWLVRLLRPPRRPAFAPPPRVLAGQVAVTFGGHATVAVRYPELAIAFDPMLGRWCGAVRRAVEPGIAPGDLDDVGLVLISHGHRDHLHLPTLARLPRAATVIVPQGVARLVSPLGFARVIELAAGGDLDVRGVQVHAFPVRHGDAPLARGLAYLVRGSGPSVFLHGDGAWYSGLAEIGARHAPDLALLPIGGYHPRSFRERHMSPLDALYAFEDLRARLMIPIHHGAFALSYERLDEPARWLRQLVRERGLDDHVRVLAPGETEVFVAPRRETAPPPDVRVDAAPAAAPAALAEPPAEPPGDAPAEPPADPDDEPTDVAAPAGGGGVVAATVSDAIARSVEIAFDDLLEERRPLRLDTPPAGTPAAPPA